MSGLTSEDKRSRLFAENNLDYNQVVELALALKAADRHAAVASFSKGGTNGSWGGPAPGSCGAQPYAKDRTDSHS